MVRVCVVIVLTESIAPTVLIASAQVPFAADHVVVIEQQHDFGDHRGLVDQQRHVVVIEGRGRRVRGRSGGDDEQTEWPSEGPIWSHIAAVLS